MASEAKIAVLLRTLEVDEQKLMGQRATVQAIVDQRQAVVEALVAGEARVREKLDKGGKAQRLTPLQQGEVKVLAEWERFSKRLQKELDAKAPQRIAAEKELHSALQRLSMVDEELLQLRVERKRIERIIENREARERIQNQALDEASSDELNVYKNRK